MKKYIKYANFLRIGTGVALRSRFNHDRSQKYLIEQISKIPGLPAKAAQIFALRTGLPDTIQVEPLPLEWVKEKLFEKQSKFAAEITEISEAVAVASLGQVHRVRIQNGSELAIKIRYPEVDKTIEEQLDLLLMGLKKFGRGKEYGLDVSDYESFLRESFKEELDYHHEALQQEKFRLGYSKYSSIIIPKIYKEWSDSEILVQSFEESIFLAQICGLSQAEKKNTAENLIRFLCAGIFENGLVHADLHPKNWGFRDNESKLIIYDFGSSLALSPDITSAFRRLALRNSSMSRIDLLECFEIIGFDSNKMLNIADRLPLLTEVLFRPFTMKQWDPRDWKLGESVTEILGAERWWFRTAGPAWFMQLMRSALAVVEAVQRLEVSIDVQAVLAGCLPNSVQNTSRSSNHSSIQITDMKTRSTSLRVLVTENGSRIVEIELPVRVVDELENTIPDEVRRNLESQNIDIELIKKRAQISGYVPQELFMADNGNRHYRVWIA